MHETVNVEWIQYIYIYMYVQKIRDCAKWAMSTTTDQYGYSLQVKNIWMPPPLKLVSMFVGKPWVWLYEITFARLLRWVSWVEMFDSYEQWMNIAHLWMIYHDLPINMMIFNSKTVELPEAIQSQ